MMRAIVAWDEYLRPRDPRIVRLTVAGRSGHRPSDGATRLHRRGAMLPKCPTFTVLRGAGAARRPRLDRHQERAWGACGSCGLSRAVVVRDAQRAGAAAGAGFGGDRADPELCCEAVCCWLPVCQVQYPAIPPAKTSPTTTRPITIGLRSRHSRRFAGSTVFPLDVTDGGLHAPSR